MTTSRENRNERGAAGSPERRIRATSTSGQPAAPGDQPQAAVTTAEIPTVGTTRVMGAIGAYAASPTRQVLHARPDPAPAGLRLVVWTLVFICIVVALGLLAVYVHPTWFSFLRHTMPTPHALGLVTGALVGR